MSTTSRPRPRQPLLIGAGLLLTLLLGAAAIGLALRLAYVDQALPGTRVAGVALGGASAAEARRRLRPVVGQDVPVVLRAAGRTYRISPALAGYRVDLDATVARALQAGRDGALGGILATVTGAVRTREVPLVARVDERRFDRTVRGLAAEIDRTPYAGGLRITTDPIAVDTEEPRPGREVDRAQLARLLRRGVRRRGATPVAVPVAVRPVASPAAVHGVARAAERYLKAPLVLSGAGPALRVRPDQLAGVVALESTDHGRRVRLGAGDRRLARLVARLAAQRDRQPRDARISVSGPGVLFDDKEDASWRARAAQVRVREGRAGRRVGRAATGARIEAAIRAGRHRAAFASTPVPAAITQRQARRVDALLSTFTTHYVPGQPRVTNIRRIARSVDGTLIAPGRQFSLNGVAGERTKAKGYVEAPFIAEGNKLEPSVGGGVSQASTTIYNAAYFAGLRIDSHTPHSVFISRYPAGRESTLNFGSIDLLWTNDTDAPILVRATTTADAITVSLFGHDTGRRVRAQSAPRKPVPGGDFSVVVTRVIRYGDGHVTREPYTTTYGIEQPSEG